MKYKFKKLNSDDIEIAKQLFRLFKKVFDNEKISSDYLPSDSYLEKVLKEKSFHAFVATLGDEVVGGLTSYDFPVYLKEEKEMYLYDLAVDEKHRRQNIASMLVEEIKKYARANNISTIFVEAEKEDREAVYFYKSLKAEQITVEHFNIKID